MFDKEINKVASIAEEKVNLLNSGKCRYLLSSMLAGLYVGLGIMLAFSIGGILSAAKSQNTKMIMGASFGVALSLVMMAGAELFTGNNFVMMVGFLRKKASFIDVLKVWFFSFLGNLIGSVIGAYAFYGSGLISNTTASFLINASVAKISLSIHELIIRGILCNVLVCLAVWCGVKMKEEIAKLIMIFWCLFAFVTTGFEHCVANMTLLSLALVIPHSQNVTLAGVIYNIGFVTIGNVIGGAVIVAISYYFISNKDNKQIKDREVLN